MEKVSYRSDDCVLLDPPLPRTGAEYEWELVTRAGAGQYVAIALSEDDKMGEDLVIACGDVGLTFWLSAVICSSKNYCRVTRMLNCIGTQENSPSCSPPRVW